MVPLLAGWRHVQVHAIGSISSRTVTMAYLAPSDITRLALASGKTAELETLDLLRRSLPQDYTVFHSVHWSREYRNVPVFGEADFIVVNRAGEALVIEQKRGMVDETPEGLFKTYDGERKNVVRQLHRTLDGIREKFKLQNSGLSIPLDYLFYFPDHRLKSINAAGLDIGRIVDASRAADLPGVIQSLLGLGQQNAFGDRVLRFFEQSFNLVVDVHAHVVANERSLIRQAGGLASILECFEMKPLRLRVQGTAGCGKTAVAARFFNSSVAMGKRPLLVCFNRPLAEKLKAALGPGGRVTTWYGLLADFLRSQGKTIDFSRLRTDSHFWQDLQEQILGETISEEWLFDTLIVDEGQDFEAGWFDTLRLFSRERADILWLEDPDQNLRHSRPVALEEEFVGFRARVNYRSPASIAQFLHRTLPFQFEMANDLPGLGVGVATYSDPDEQPALVAQVVTDLLKRGFKHNDITVLSLRGLASSTLGSRQRVGNYTLSRFSGEYDLLGNQIFEKGQIRFDTAQRFKGQQSPAVILTDVDPDGSKLEASLRTVFSGATRATVRLEMLVRKDNPDCQRFLQ
jgi:hypothetical protein